jgi:hypothetical protein
LLIGAVSAAEVAVAAIGGLSSVAAAFLALLGQRTGGRPLTPSKSGVPTSPSFKIVEIPDEESSFKDSTTADQWKRRRQAYMILLVSATVLF